MKKTTLNRTMVLFAILGTLASATYAVAASSPAFCTIENPGNPRMPTLINCPGTPVFYLWGNPQCYGTDVRATYDQLLQIPFPGYVLAITNYGCPFPNVSTCKFDGQSSGEASAQGSVLANYVDDKLSSLSVQNFAYPSANGFVCLKN